MGNTENKDLPQKSEISSEKLLIGGYIAIFVSTLIVLFLPVMVTKLHLSDCVSIDVDSPNEIGDTIGGIMGPAVGVIGVIITFLAFWAQYQANQEQRRQFLKTLKQQEKDKQIQQFESQFYEMLRLHKENVNELEISTGNGEKVTGRKTFELMNRLFRVYLIEMATIQKNGITDDGFECCYDLFFWGIDRFKEQNKIDFFADFSSSEELEKDPLSYQLYRRVAGINEKDYFGKLEVPLVVIGQGYSAYLGHYFRHLYMMVKFVDETNVFGTENSSESTYKVKMRYLKILRAQLSNYEQIMIFYNWLGKYGDNWENEQNRYFTEYCMIHNLWKGELFSDKYILDKVSELEIRKPVSRKGRLFEYHELIGE